MRDAELGSCGVGCVCVCVFSLSSIEVLFILFEMCSLVILSLDLFT